MRTRYIPFAGFIGLALGAMAWGGCDNISAGVPPEPPGPPTVTHIVFLDANRGINPDLLNNKPAEVCNDLNPCVQPVACGTLYGFQIDAAGATKCHDPENVTEVKPGVDAAIRVVFNKLVDPSIETTETDANGVVSYTLVPDLITLQDSSGKTVDAEASYVISGSPQFTSDPNGLPYGPALVLTPKAPLAPGTKYTIVMKGELVKARVGGQALTAENSKFDFTTEGLFVMAGENDPFGSRVGDAGTINFPDASEPAEVAPNQALQYRFNADVDEASLSSIALTNAAGATVKVAAVAAFDPTECEAGKKGASDLRVVNIIPVDDAGEIVKLAPGDYEISVAGVKAADSDATAPTATVAFTVGTADVAEDDPFAAGFQILPACPPDEPPPADGGTTD